MMNLQEELSLPALIDSEVMLSGVATVSWLLGFIVNTHINTITIVMNTMAAIIVIIGVYLFFFLLGG